MLRQGSSYENWRTKASFAALILASIAVRSVGACNSYSVSSLGGAGFGEPERGLEDASRSPSLAVVVLRNRTTIIRWAYACGTRERKRSLSCRCLVVRGSRVVLRQSSSCGQLVSLGGKPRPGLQCRIQSQFRGGPARWCVGSGPDGFAKEVFLLAASAGVFLADACPDQCPIRALIWGLLTARFVR